MVHSVLTLPVLEIVGHIVRAYTPTPEGGLIILVIWGMAIRALLIVRQRRAAIRREAAFLGQLRKLEAPVGRWEENKLAGVLAKAPRDSLTRRYANTIWAQRSSAHPDLSAITDMVAQGDAAKLAFPRITPNLTMLLGLIGTVIGLAAVVRALGPQILSAANASNPQEMAHALSGQLGNLQTAFACTLHGISAAIFVLLITNAAERRQNDLLADLDEFGLNFLAPHILPVSQEAQLEMLHKVLDESRAFVKTISEQMTLASSNLEKQVTLLDATTAKTTQELTMMTNVVGTMLVHVRASSDKIRESTTAMEKLQTEIHEVYAALMEKHDKAERSFTDRSEEVIGAMGRLQGGFNTNANAIIERLQTAAAAYLETTADFKAAGTDFRNMSKEIGTSAYAAIAATANEFRDALLAHQQAVDRVEAGMRELLTRLDPRLLPREEWERMTAAMNQMTQAGEILVAELSARASTRAQPTDPARTGEDDVRNVKGAKASDGSAAEGRR